MKLDFNDILEENENKALFERIQKLKYSMIYDYRNRQNCENLLMFIMDN